MSLHFGVGTGTGVRAVTDLRLARPTGRGCTCVSCFFLSNTCRVQRLSETPGPQLHTGGSGARAVTNQRLARPVRRGCTCARFSQGAGKVEQQLTPVTMSRQINQKKEAFLASVGPWSAGIAVPYAGVVCIRIGGAALRSGKQCDGKPRRPILSRHQNPNFFHYSLSNPTSREGRINRKNRVGVRRFISSVPVITAGAEHDATQQKCGQSATGNSRFRPCRFYFDQRIGGVPSKSGNRHEYNPRRTILTTTETGSTWESQRDSSNNPTQPCVSSLLKPENFAARFRFSCYPKRSSAATCADYTCFPAGSRRQAPFLSLPAPHDGARHDFPVRRKSASLTQVYSPGRFRAVLRHVHPLKRTVGRGPVFDNSPSKSGAVKPGFF